MPGECFQRQKNMPSPHPTSRDDPGSLPHLESSTEFFFLIVVIILFFTEVFIMQSFKALNIHTSILPLV